MQTWEWLLIGWAAPACLAQCAIALWMLWIRFEPPRLDALVPATPTEWPRLSIIIPARNEADTLEAALSTLLLQTYPHLEIVLINDRSTDDTQKIVDRMAKRDARIRPLTLDSLPHGWLGKVHALHRGVELATGEWFLFTDADVHFAPSALERAVAHCLESRIEFLSILPTFAQHSLLQNASMVAFAEGFLAATRADELGREGSDAYVGVGAFNLVRADAYARSEGFEWLKLEIADDAGLAYVLKRAGARAALLMGGDLIDIDWYPNLRAMVRGLEKNTFAATARFSFARMAVLAVLLSSAAVAPLVAAFQTALPYLSMLGAMTLLVNTLVHAHTARVLRVSFAAGLLAPLGLLLMVYALLRSAAICYRDGGIRWRETWYPMDALRSGQRVKL